MLAYRVSTALVALFYLLFLFRNTASSYWGHSKSDIQYTVHPTVTSEDIVREMRGDRLYEGWEIVCFIRDPAGQPVARLV